MIDRRLLVVLGLVLVASGIVGWRNEKSLEHEARFWRQMYREAERDAKFKKCVDLDRNFVVCEKVTP